MNKPVLIEGTFTKVPNEEWKERLQTAKEELAKRTVPAFLDFCREVHAFRKHCDKTQGGSEFTVKGCEWLGVTPATLHAWNAVGMRSNELSGAPESLPRSEDSICRIASLDDIAFRKALPQLRPDMPRKEVRELVKDLNPPPKPDPVDEREKKEKQWAKVYGMATRLERDQLEMLVDELKAWLKELDDE